MNTVRRTIADPSSLEGRFASRVAGALTLHSQALPHDIAERLRFGRDQALAKAREARLRTATGSAVVGVSRGGAATLGQMSPWWQRAASVLPLVVLVTGILMIERWNSQEQIQAAAEIDALLLSDSLPPAAYSDPGFAEFLKNSPAP